MKTLYTAIATARGGRDGHVTSSDGILDVDVKPPKELGGAGGATNPEQLFAAGYAACFENAMVVVCRMQKKPVPDGLLVTAHVNFNVTDDKRYVLSVALHGKAPGMTSDEMRALMEAGHQVCPYSNATRGNIEVALVAE